MGVPPRKRPYVLLLLLALTAGWLLTLGWLHAARASAPTATPTTTPSPTPSPTTTPTPTRTPTPRPTPTDQATLPPPPRALHFPRGLTILALRRGASSQLWAYQPQTLPFTRLTHQQADLVSPALAPDGHAVAYAAHTATGWDLFLLSLPDGHTTRLTRDAAYDDHPTWSPDGLWLAYTHDSGGNLDIFIRPAQGTGEPLRLTTHPAADEAPAWAPQGRLIAFISTREGSPQVFLVNLDMVGADRYRRISQPTAGPACHPAWSLDGRYLAWSQQTPQGDRLFLWDAAHPDQPPQPVGPGLWPAWGKGHVLVAVVPQPNGDALTAYDPAGNLVLPLLPLPGTVAGLTLRPARLPWPLPLPLRQAARQTPTPLWTPHAAAAGANGRQQVVSLPPDVHAPYSKLSDAADEAFRSLRQTLARKAGWDVLGTLEQAFVPLTAPLPPGLERDWLYTGRAFALPTRWLQEGKMVVVREELPQGTYWRVFVRAAQQDGAQGRPLQRVPWDFAARAQDPVNAYEQGGALAATLPPGYWVDVTAWALASGWERLPALPNWRAYVFGARATEFALRQGLKWEEAMAQLYPSGSWFTPTPHPTATAPFRRATPRP